MTRDPTRRPPDRLWKPAKRLSANSRTAQQDRAAGGRAARSIMLGNGKYVTAHITLRPSRRDASVKAYLRWKVAGQPKQRYLGEVDADTRMANLAQAWRLAAKQGVGSPTPPADSWASSTATRAVMVANGHRDTRPEKRLRSALHRLGLRYRVATRPIPSLRRTADVVFRKARVAVFVDGCYWHGCPEHYRPAKNTNQQFWSSKIATNRDRDNETNRLLTEDGWKVIRLWEHDDPVQGAENVARIVKARSTSGTNGGHFLPPPNKRKSPKSPAFSSRTRAGGGMSK